MEWLWIAFATCFIGVCMLLGTKAGLYNRSLINVFIAVLLFGASVFGSVALMHPHIPYYLFFLLPSPFLLGLAIGTFWGWMRRTPQQ